MSSRPFYPATHPNTNPYQAQQQHAGQFDNYTSGQEPAQPRASGSGLIRLTLRKPMGIVFEPLPPSPAQAAKKGGTGVRICDLPRTGAAYMSGRLEIGDELLSINDVTMSRLTFDQIMDFIINTDPEGLRLLFRRPRKEDVNATTGSTPSASIPNSHEDYAQNRTSAVKWGQDEVHHQEEIPKRKKKVKAVARESDEMKYSKHNQRKSKPAPTPSLEEEDDATEMDEDEDEMTEMDDEDNTYMSEEPSVLEQKQRNARSKQQKHHQDNTRKGKSNTAKANRNANVKPKPKAEESSFLDMLINNICQAVTPGSKKRDDFSDDGISEAEGTFADEDTYADESTYVEGDDPSLISHDQPPKKNGKNKDVGTGKRQAKKNTTQMQAYEDDQTLETTDTQDRPRPHRSRSEGIEEEGGARFADADYEQGVPLGLAPKRKSKKKNKRHELELPAALEGQDMNRMMLPSPMSQQDVNLPFRELEYNPEADGGDVSVLTNNMSQYGSHISPQALVYAHSYVPEPGKTLEESIETNPERFYRHVVSEILAQNEPEKVRLLDKLLAKYQGREEHLIQKLTLRYRPGSGKQVQKSESSEPSSSNRYPDGEAPNDVDPWKSNSISGYGSIKAKDEFPVQQQSSNFFQPLHVDASQKEFQQKDQESAVYETFRSVGTMEESSPISQMQDQAFTFDQRAPTPSHISSRVNETITSHARVAETAPPPPPKYTEPVYEPKPKQQQQQQPNNYEIQNQTDQGEEDVYYDDEPDEEEQHYQHQGHHLHEQVHEDEYAQQQTVLPAFNSKKTSNNLSDPFGKRNSKPPTLQEFHEDEEEEESQVDEEREALPEPSPVRPQPQKSRSQSRQTDSQAGSLRSKNQSVRSTAQSARSQGQSTRSTPSARPQSKQARAEPPPAAYSPPQEEEYSEPDNETEGEDSAYTSDYSGSQIDGTSPAVIAQVSELLNFVYGKTTVSGQIDRVSTIMRAYEGRENVLLELLETKALIKANQQEEEPPHGLISTNSADSGTYEEEHPDDISSVSGDASTRFNVKVPMDSDAVSPMVSPMTHPTMDTPRNYRETSARAQNQGNKKVSRQQQQRPVHQSLNEKENVQGNGYSNKLAPAKPRPQSSPVLTPSFEASSFPSISSDKKKMGKFLGLFKGKKAKPGKGNSPKSKGLLADFAEQEREI